MSDDTPTERFDAAGEDAPTERFDAVGDAPTERLAAGEPEVPLEVVEERKNRRLIIILASVGGALLLAVLIILVLLLTRQTAPAPSPTPTGSTTPSVAPTPIVTPTKTPTPTPPPTPTPTPTQTVAPPPPPPSNNATVNDFSGTDTISCNSDAPVTPDYTLYFEWSTSNANQIFFGVATNDASQAALFTNLPPNGNSQDDFPYPVEFQCPAESQTYTITVVGSNGSKDSETITVENTGDTQ